MNRKRFLVAVSMAVTLVASSVVTMASVEVRGYKLITNGVEKEQLLALPIVGDCDLVPLRLTLEEMGVTDFKWEPSTSEGVKGKITITLDSYFRNAQLRNLKRGLIIENPYWYGKLPEAVTTLLTHEAESNKMAANCIPNQKRGIEIDIKSEGYTTAYMFYDYQIIHDKLYVSDNLFQSIGIDGVIVDKGTKEVTINVPSKEEIQKEIDTIQNALHTSDSELLLGIWIRGQQFRSGALQYATLSDALKGKVLPEIKERGWVTGGSSPALQGGEVTLLNKEEVSGQEVKYTVQYESMLQGKVYETLQQTITMAKQKADDAAYWEITDVQGDVGYYTYEMIRMS